MTPRFAKAIAAVSLLATCLAFSAGAQADQLDRVKQRGKLIAGIKNDYPPFGSLDAITRDVLHDELERVWRQTGLTVVFVTHNVREAARLGDRIVLLASRPGRLAAEFEVDLARPRRIEDAGVTTLATEVTDHLRREVARHGRVH
jgi:ABC-type amino acid transport substrate-binding protein